MKFRITAVLDIDLSSNDPMQNNPVVLKKFAETMVAMALVQGIPGYSNEDITITSQKIDDTEDN